MDKFIIVGSSIALTGLIIWWFFGKKTSTTIAATDMGDYQIIDITVDGAYLPNIVQLQKGKPAKLVFMRKDPSSCFEEVVMSDFGVSQKLPVNKSFEITVNPDKAGEFTYSCGMHMFFGKVVVK